jgi:hypothetical protein
MTANWTTKVSMNRTFDAVNPEIDRNRCRSKQVRVLRSITLARQSSALTTSNRLWSAFRGRTTLRQPHGCIDRGAFVMLDEQRRWRPPVQFYQPGESTREALKALLAKSTRTLPDDSVMSSGVVGRPAPQRWIRRIGTVRPSPSS